MEIEEKPGDQLFIARARVDDGAWFRWRPLHRVTLLAIVGNDENYVSRKDWNDIKSEPSRIYKIWSPAFLLADARLIFRLGYKRSALIEACTALEVAIERFMEKPNLEGLFDAEQLRGINLANLLQKKNDVGVRVVVNLWLPILFPRSILPSETIEAVQEAVDDRNKVAHKGMRRIDEKKLHTQIRHVDILCKILRAHTCLS